jgi:hypothetical protein
VDSRDIWLFDGNKFQSIGNQKVKEYFFGDLNPLYYTRVFMINNTRRNQIELYYPSLASTGWCDKMISYRYDLQAWNPPRTVNAGASGLEAPPLINGAFDLSKRRVWYGRGGVNNSQLIQTGVGTSFSGSPIQTQFGRSNVQFLDIDNKPIPYTSKVYTHRIAPEVTGNANLMFQIGGASNVNGPFKNGPQFAVSTAATNPWFNAQNNANRATSVTCSDNSSTSSWNLSALNWQIAKSEDSY